MEEKNISSLKRGDEVLITYKRPGSKVHPYSSPKEPRDIGFFLEYKNKTIYLTRHDPLKNPEDKNVVLDAVPYPLKSISKIEKI